jgi:hypothetical protein
MAFEVFSSIGGRGGIPRGSLSLTSRGMARFNAADLKAVGVNQAVTILIDRKARSIAVRAPLEGEQGQAVGTENRAMMVWMAGAMRLIGLTPGELHGWHSCAIVEDRVEIQFKPSPESPGRKGRGK